MSSARALSCGECGMVGEEDVLDDGEDAADDDEDDEGRKEEATAGVEAGEGKEDGRGRGWKSREARGKHEMCQAESSRFASWRHCIDV